VNCPTSSPPNQSPNDSPKRRWNLPNLHLGGPDPNSLLSSDPKPKFPSSFQNKKKSIKIRFKMFHHYQINQKSEFCLFCVGSIETIAGGWKSSYSFHSLINIFCFVLLLISSARFGRRPSHAMRILPFSHCVGSRDHPRKITERRRQQ
jgi:hypothetical protein